MANYEFNFEDSNEEYSGVEVVDPVLETKPEQTVQVVGLEETEGFIYVDLVDEENIVTDSESAFPAMGDRNDELRHSLLTGRDLQDQHPVSAITGLREELNFIKSLKTVYSDKRQVADYYQWEDTNYYDENRVGYFVTVCEDANSIKICNGTNVFGVTVDQAAFVGGQDNIERGDDYGLVVNNGVAHVRCETDVTTGDYIVSNQYGMAKKNGEDYGFKVIGIEWVDGVKFAIIALNLSVDQIDTIGENIVDFNSRLDGVETNILSAINLANEAYLKSLEASNNASTAVDTSSNVSNNFEDIVSQVDDNNQLVQQAIEVSVQAQTIANSAITTAETLRQEAINAANEALVETTNTKNEFIETKDILQQEVDNAQTRLDGAFEELKNVKDAIEPLAYWESKDGTLKGAAGFLAKADENQTSLDTLAGFEYGNNQNLYPYTNTPKDDNGDNTVGSLDSINGIIFTDNGDKIIIANGTASDNADFYITQNLKLSEGEYSISGCAKNGDEKTYNIIVKQTKPDGTDLFYKDIGLYENIGTEETVKGGCRFTITNGDIISIWIRIYKGQSVNDLEFKPSLQKIYKGISGLKNQVAKNGSSIELLTSFNSDGGTGVAGLIAQVSDHESILNSVTSWQDETSKSIAGTHSEASKNLAKMSNIASVDNKISALENKVTNEYATIKSLTNFEGNLASIEQKSDASGASIRLLVANMDKYNVGTLSPAYGFNSTQAKEVLEDGVIYVPTVAHTENTYTSSAYSFTVGYYYVWVKNSVTWTAYSNKVLFSGTIPSGKTYPYWYTNSGTVTSGYEPYTLYKLEEYVKDGKTSINWIAVASFKGDFVNRAISQIRQNANSINAEITNAKGSFGSLSAKLSDTDSKVQTIANWQSTTGSSLSSFMNNASNNFASATQVAKIVDKNGNINAASIVTAVNNSGSSVAIKADKIVMTGTTTFLKPSDLSSSGTTTISGNRVRTGTIASNNYVYGQSGMAIDLSNGAIYCKNFSVNTSGDVSISGKITASSGSIAGFNIGQGKAYSNSLSKVVTLDNGTQYEIGMKATAGENDLAFYVWKTTNNWSTKEYTFFIRNNGQLYAQSGTIGGWTIKNGYLDSYVGSTNKRMYLSSGNQTADSWIKAYDASGNTSFKITKEGVMHAAGAVISGKITATSGNFANGVTIGGSSITAGDLRKLYRAARLGYNDSDSLQILRIDATSGKVGNWIITSAHLYCSSDTSQVFLDSTYLKVYTSSTWYNATWKQVAVAGKNSDARLKHNILNVESKYEELFNCLQPKTFGYTEKAQSGDPNHIHFGFIAQDILATEKQLNLDNLSFVFDNEGYYGLKMDEFIALNTWQIQKAKARISELEEKVSKLEKLINDK